MRKDIEIHINTGDITLNPQNRVTLREFQWVENPGTEQRYIYGEVIVPGFVTDATIRDKGLYIEIPYTPLYNEFMLRIKRSWSEDNYEYLVNPKDGSDWFIVKAAIHGSNLDNVYASQLIAISENRFYLTFNEEGYIRLYSGNESDMSVIKANWQNRNLLLKCVPGNNFRYPLTGVGLIRWTNSNISVSKLAQTLKEQFADDGTPVQSARYDFDSRQLYMKIDTSNVDGDGDV